MWPWAEPLLEELGGAEPEVLSAADGIDFEAVAALEPDLIVGTNAGLTEKDYELLSGIAPTVTSVEGSTQYFSSWSDQTLQIARALGREADGQALVDGVMDRYAALAAEHPEWGDLTATFSQGGPYDGQLYVYPDGLSTDFLTDLGFSITPGLEEYAPDSGSQALISGENVDLLEADVVVFATESEEMFDELQAFAHRRQPAGRDRGPRRLHRRDARRRHLLRHPAEPHLRPRGAHAAPRSRLDGHRPASVPVLTTTTQPGDPTHEPDPPYLPLGTVRDGRRRPAERLR